jgi:hypothetical protein
MTAWISASRVLGAGLALALNAQAATTDDDEARIEVLVNAERPAVAARMPPPTDTYVPAVATAVVPLTASAIAAPGVPARSAAPSRDSWVAPAEPTGGLPFNDLVRHIGDRVAVVTAGARVHRGVVKAVDAEQVTLQVHSPGSVGAATYTLRREQIVRIDLR